MKMMYGNTPVKSLNIHYFNENTNDATMVSSDLQAGVTAYARGQKITGTGKAFSFAMYGNCPSNITLPIPVSEINTINISSDSNTVRLTNKMDIFRSLDFSTPQTVAVINIDGIEYEINFKVGNNSMTVSCNQNITLQVLFGKDDYI